MKCKKAQSIISLVIDEEASSKECSSLQFHIMGCPACKRLFEMSQDISAHVQNLPEPVPLANLETKVLRRLEEQKTKKSHKKTSIYFIIAASFSLFVVFTLFFSTTSDQTSDYFAENTMGVEIPIDSMLHTTGDTTSLEITKTDRHHPEIAMQFHDDKHRSLSQVIKYSIRTAPPVQYTRQSCMVSF